MDQTTNPDDYQVIRVIGKGTFGTILLCKRNSDGRTVVLKEVTINVPKDDKFKETQNEIDVLSTLNHPFIIRYFGNFHENGSIFICMEFATNGNLAEYMSQKQHYLVPQYEVLFFFTQIVIGVQHIHSKNIIHRDLKAENIFLSGPYGNIVKIGDFGIAKILGNDKAKSVIGTPYYLAPEICQNKPYDFKTDIWALGCLLYEMCTHKRAFESDTLVGLINQIVTGNILPINTCFYGRQMQEIIDNMLTIIPEKRCNIDQLINNKIFQPLLKQFANFLIQYNADFKLN